jgi:hypothetical protein
LRSTTAPTTGTPGKTTRNAQQPMPPGDEPARGGEAKQWLGHRGWILVLVLGALSPSLLFLMGGHGAGKSAHAAGLARGEQGEERLASSEENDSRDVSGGESQNSDPLKPVANPQTVGKELVLKVIESNDEDTRDIATPKFLADLEYNRAILNSTDLDKLQVKCQGKFWLQGTAPYQLPPRVDGEPGKAGVALLRLVYLDGQWKVHDLNVQ